MQWLNDVAQIFTALGVILGIIVSWFNRNKLKDITQKTEATHNLVNGRMDTLIEASKVVNSTSKVDALTAFVQLVNHILEQSKKGK